MKTPDPEHVRRTLAAFDERQRKIVGGLIAVMIRRSERVREREWICEQFTQLALLTAEEDDTASPDARAAALGRYVRANIDDVLNASYELFLRVAADMAARAHEDPSHADAVAQALTYFGGEVGDDPSREGSGG